MSAYLRDPAEIYRRSFAMIRAEADLSGLPSDLSDLAVRLIHACGMTDIVAELRWSSDFSERAREALGIGAKIVADSRMVADGIIAPALRADGRIICALDTPGLAEHAAKSRLTRTAAGFELNAAALNGSVVAIGNAPTALFRLLELVDEGQSRPAAIVAFPVGFVGAAESKAELAANPRGIPFLTLLGRRGGSAMAAAAINALTAQGPGP